jgi:hypothetical protein
MYSMCAQEQNESSDLPDGHRWLSLDENSKYAYIVGFLEGMFLGHCFTTWGLSGGMTGDAPYRHATDSYNEHWKRLVSNTVYRNFFEGLDALYADADNRKIAVRDGMWIVMNKVSGKSEMIMKSMIEAFREKTYESTESLDVERTIYFKQNLVH